jgi:hypothetical protein
MALILIFPVLSGRKKLDVVVSYFDITTKWDNTFKLAYFTLVKHKMSLYIFWRSVRNYYYKTISEIFTSEHSCIRYYHLFLCLLCSPPNLYPHIWLCLLAIWIQHRVIMKQTKTISIFSTNPCNGFSCHS